MVLFLIIFAETGLVVTPFLPGDSLLFAVGAVAAHPDSPIRLGLIAVLLVIAAVLGDAVNYYIGYRLGPHVFSRDDSWLLNKKHLKRAHEFYEEYGGITIILAQVHPDRAHVRPVRRRHRQDELPAIRRLQRRRAAPPGSCFFCSRAGGSADERSFRKTSSW